MPTRPEYALLRASLAQMTVSVGAHAVVGTPVHFLPLEAFAFVAPWTYQAMQWPAGMSTAEAAPLSEGTSYVAARLDRLAERVTKLERAMERRPESAWLNTLAVADLELVRPVHVTIDDDENGVGAYWDEVALYGEGKTVSEAMSALRAEIVSAYRGLRERQASGDVFIDYAARLWGVLSACVKHAAAPY